MDERIPITAAAPWAESRLDGGDPISQGVSRPIRALAWWATRQYSPALKRALFDVNLRFNRTMSVLAAPAEARVREAVRILVIAPRSEEHSCGVSRRTDDG